MRISDWSSDVCSSDLEYDLAPDFPVLFEFLDHWRREIEAALHSVRIAHDRLIRPTEWCAVNVVISIQLQAICSGDRVRARTTCGSGCPLTTSWYLPSRACRSVRTNATRSAGARSEAPTSELQSLMRISFAFFSFNK